MEFDSIDFVKSDAVLRIDYVKQRPFGPAIVCRIELDTDDVDVQVGVGITGQQFVDDVDVRRFAISGGDFPPVDSGMIEFERFELDAGEEIKGRFEAVFDDDRDIRGKFEGKVREEISTEPG